MGKKYQLLLKWVPGGSNQQQEIMRELEASGWRTHGLAQGSVLFMSNQSVHSFKSTSEVERYLMGHLTYSQRARLEIVEV